MNLARAIHLDESDTLVFHRHARTGEWVISGGFEFSNWSQADLTGKARQAFSNGWLGLETFGRVTLAAVTQIEADEFATLADNLARHFVDIYGAPDLEQARLVALDELQHMVDMCDSQDANTIFTVARELSEVGVNEAYRIIESQGAELIQVTGDGCNS
jgi:hypothetical protein